jgi:hypothetical protein
VEPAPADRGGWVSGKGRVRRLKWACPGVSPEPGPLVGEAIVRTYRKNSRDCFPGDPQLRLADPPKSAFLLEGIIPKVSEYRNRVE